MLIKFLNEQTGTLDWADAGDFQPSNVAFFTEGDYVHGRATLADGKAHEIRSRIGNSREKAERRVFQALQLSHAYLRPRPSREAIAAHLARQPAAASPQP